MTEKELWDAYVARNPKWADESYEMRLSAGMLRKLMKSAFDAGFKHHGKITDALGDAIRGAGIDLNRFKKP